MLTDKNKDPAIRGELTFWMREAMEARKLRDEIYQRYGIQVEQKLPVHLTSLTREEIAVRIAELDREREAVHSQVHSKYGV